MLPSLAKTDLACILLRNGREPGCVLSSLQRPRTASGLGQSIDSDLPVVVMMMPVPDWVSAGGIDRADNLPKAIEREIIHTLPESEPLALREIRGPVERPAHQLTRQPCKAVVSHA